MTKELTDKLWAKYPKIFQAKVGCACSDGWYNIIDILCSNLQWNTDQNNSKDRYPQVRVTQIKEKFGGLRFYVESATPRQHEVITFVESLSYHVCEECGSMNNIGRTSGWLQTLCKDCAPTSKYYLSWKPLTDTEDEAN